MIAREPVIYRQLFVAFVLLFVASPCLAQQSAVFDPGYQLEGKSAADLSAAWWKWAYSAPAEINPVRDTSGADCGVGQQGNVWFLAGGFGSSKIIRNCIIPADKYIFFPIINMVFYPDAGSNYTCEQAKKDAAVNNESALDLFVQVDGIPINSPKRYRAKTKKCFDIFERAGKLSPTYSGFPSASDGYWLLLRPLPKGKHTIKFGGRYNNPGNSFGQMLQDIEYNISVE